MVSHKVWKQTVRFDDSRLLGLGKPWIINIRSTGEEKAKGEEKKEEKKEIWCSIQAVSPRAPLI